MNQIKQIYYTLLETYDPKGWWPIVNDKTLLCEYHVNAPNNEKEALEITFSAILAQNTKWHPNAVRAIQQLKLGRQFTNQEFDMIKQAEILQAGIIGNGEKVTKNGVLAYNNYWENSEEEINKLSRNDLIDAKKILEISNEKLSKIIRTSGYHNQKTKKLKNFCDFLLKRHDGSIKKLFKNNIKRLRRELLSVNGIGPETADSIMLYAAKKPIFVVDAYAKRIMSRVGFKEQSYDELQQLFMKSLPNSEKLFNEYHALLVELGKSTCKKQPLCGKCPINKCCVYHKTNGIS